MPLKEMKAFKRVHIKAGEEKSVSFRIPAADLRKWDMKQHGWKLYPGKYTVYVGGHSEDKKIVAGVSCK